MGYFMQTVHIYQNIISGVFCVSGQAQQLLVFYLAGKVISTFLPSTCSADRPNHYRGISQYVSMA